MTSYTHHRGRWVLEGGSKMRNRRSVRYRYPPHTGSIRVVLRSLSPLGLRSAARDSHTTWLGSWLQRVARSRSCTPVGPPGPAPSESRAVVAVRQAWDRDPPHWLRSVAPR